jgi:hypothetical protein
MNLFAQNQTEQSSKIQPGQFSEIATYRLFPTQNYWTFIKLDTRNGKMWQVHFTINDDDITGEFVLNSLPLNFNEKKEINGRFTLYPTENIYNFLLLDQIDGLVYQVQWSMDSDNRGIVSVIEPIEE